MGLMDLLSEECSMENSIVNCKNNYNETDQKLIVSLYALHSYVYHANQ